MVAAPATTFRNTANNYVHDLPNLLKSLSLLNVQKIETLQVAFFTDKQSTTLIYLIYCPIRQQASRHILQAGATQCLPFSPETINQSSKELLVSSVLTSL